MIKTMMAIEYNTWMSLIWFISRNARLISDQYGIDGTSVDVIPSYPKDLTTFRKPSIIIQKVHSKNKSVGLGGVLGEYFDEGSDRLYDIKGRIYEMEYQLNIDTDSNSYCSLLTDLIIEVLRRAMDRDDDTMRLELLDFLDDINNPVPIGQISIKADSDVTPLSSNDNMDYINALRIHLTVIQSIVGMGAVVDLTKPIKWRAVTTMSQTIKL